MPNTHAVYWMDTELKKKIEAIAVKMERSASYVASKILEAGVIELEATVEATKGGGNSLRDKIGKIKK